MIMDVWSVPITPGKETEAVDSWTRMADAMRRQFPGISCRAVRPITGNTYRILLVCEFASIAERDDLAATLNDEVKAIVSESTENKYVDNSGLEHNYYQVLE